MTELTIAAPAGAVFKLEEVKTDRGAKTLGFVPILAWESLDGATEFYGEDALLNVLDGTSLRVAFQNIARRSNLADKSDDEIATAQLSFKPGARQVGASTPVSRAKRAAAGAAEKMGDQADAMTEFLAKVANGDIDPARFAEAMELASG